MYLVTLHSPDVTRCVVINHENTEDGSRLDLLQAAEAGIAAYEKKNPKPEGDSWERVPDGFSMDGVSGKTTHFYYSPVMYDGPGEVIEDCCCMFVNVREIEYGQLWDPEA